MSENKTQPSQLSVIDFVLSVEHQERRSDALKLLDIFAEETQQPAVLWGTNMIGYGSYQYQTANKKSHRFLRTGFSPRKQNLSLYILPGFDDYTNKMNGLGKFKISKSCLYINKLSDVNEVVLRELIKVSFAAMAKRYPL